MKVALLVDRATAFGIQPAGTEIDLPKDTARRLIEAGQAQPVRRARPERAVPADVPERAVK